MIRTNNRFYYIFVLIAAIGLIPILFRDSKYLLLLLTLIGIYIIATSGLDVLFGYSGQISLGHAAFYAIGAYTSAILSMEYSFSVWISMIIGGILAGVIGIVIAFPAAKLVHHFLALVTIGFGQIVYLFICNANDITNGYSGINLIPSPSIGNFSFDTNFSYFYIVYVFCIIFLLIKYNIVHSKIGRAFIAIREDVQAANGIGINVRRFKILAFATSAFATGIAGALYAHLIGFISPESFMFSQSVLFLTMLLLGGMGNMMGPIVGTVILTVVSEYLQNIGSYQMLVYGFFLLIIILYMPNGITGSYSIRQLLFRRKKVSPDA